MTEDAPGHGGDAQAFEAHRGELQALAYRMLGSVAEAEDTVQEAFLRWQNQGHPVEHTRAFLRQVTARLCLDRLKSARVRRESYTGTWLPEPIVGSGLLDPGEAAERAEDVSLALLMVLERLTPAERAAFLLHDVFDSGYAEIAAVLGRSEDSCRKLVSRARKHVKESRDSHLPDREKQMEIAMAFQVAAASGDVNALEAVLAEDAVLYSDGGGKVPSALNPIRGGAAVARFLAGVRAKFPMADSVKVFPAVINGLPGAVLVDGARVIQTVALELHGDRVRRLYVVRNPEKLRHLDPACLE